MDNLLMVIGSGMGNAFSHHNHDLPVILACGDLKHQSYLSCPSALPVIEKLE